MAALPRNLARFFQQSTALALMLALVFQTSAFAAGEDDEDDPDSCPAVESAQKQIERKNESITKATAAGNTNLANTLQRELSRLEDKLSQAETSCENKRSRLNRDFSKCKKQMAKAPGLYTWDTDKQQCVDKQKRDEKSNPNSGECNNAEILKGSNLKGEACKTAEQAVKDVSARQEAVNGAALVATQAYSTMQATQATGAQADTQVRQQKMMQALAAMKITTGVLALSGAASLKAAANGAEEAKSNISSAHKDLYDYCYQPAMVAKMTPEQCFYQNAQSRGVPATAQNYANFERMKSAADQSEEAAAKANALAKTALVQGGAELAVGMQALYMSRQAAQTAANFAPPPVVPGSSIALAPMNSTSGSNGGLGTPLAPDSGGAVGGEGPELGGSDGGQIKGGLIGGRPMAFNTYKPERSGVSGGGGGGGVGGGGRGGGGGGRSRSGGKGNTTAGEYTNSGSGTMGGGAKAAAAKDAAGNPLDEIMKKLFPPDPATGKPVVDGRDVASEQPEDVVDGQGETGGVEMAELSIFEQVNARYRALNGKGQI